MLPMIAEITDLQIKKQNLFVALDFLKSCFIMRKTKAKGVYVCIIGY